jgi:hypothetical protein
MKIKKNDLMHEPARRSARLTVRHGHRGRHRYRSRLCARQHGRDYRVLVGRVCDWTVHRSAAPAPPRTARRRITYQGQARPAVLRCPEMGDPAEPIPQAGRYSRRLSAEGMVTRHAYSYSTPALLSPILFRYPLHRWGFGFLLLTQCRERPER